MVVEEVEVEDVVVEDVVVEDVVAMEEGDKVVAEENPKIHGWCCPLETHPIPMTHKDHRQP